MHDPCTPDCGEDNVHYTTSDSSDFSGDDASTESDDCRNLKPSWNYNDDCFESPLQNLESELYISPRIYSSKFLNEGEDVNLLQTVTTVKKEDSIGKTIKAATLRLSAPQAIGKKSNLNREISISDGNLTSLSSLKSHTCFSKPQVSPLCSSVEKDKDSCQLDASSHKTINILNSESFPLSLDSASKLELRRRRHRHQKLQAHEKHNSELLLTKRDEKTCSYLKLSPFLHNYTEDLPASLSKKCSEESTIDYVSDRHLFFKSFLHMVRQGRRGRQNGSKFRRMDSTEEQLPVKELKHFIWMELLAWHKGCSVEQQEIVLSLQRQAVLSGLEDILFFYVKDISETAKHKKPLVLLDTSLNAKEEIDDLSSLVIDDMHHTCSSVLDCVRKISVDDCVKRGTTFESLHKRRRASAINEYSTKGEYLWKCESGLKLFRRKVSEVIEAKSMQEVVERLEKSHIDSSEEKKSVSSTSSDQSNDDFGLHGDITITNMEMLCECSDTLSKVCSNCVNKETEALQQVTDVINKLDKIEHLYPSTNKLAEEYPIYSRREFTAKVKTLNLWYNIINDLRQKIDLLAALFGIRNRQKIGWPCYTVENKIFHSGESATGKGSDIKVIKHLKHVHFKNITPPTSSPSSSGSDWSERSKSSVPPSPDVKQVNPFDMMLPSQINSSNVIRVGTEVTCATTQSIYRRYVDHTLRQKGLKLMYRQLSGLLRPILYRIHAVLKKPKPTCTEKIVAKIVTDPPASIEKTLDSVGTFSREYCEELSKYGVWSEFFQEMGLPTFHRSFFFLLRVLLDVVHECLLLRLDQQPVKPSALSVGQLIKECKEVLRAATQTRQRYINLAQTVLGDGGSEIIEAQFDSFDDDLENMLQVYLDYLQQRILMMKNMPQLTLQQKSYLEEEWAFVRVICPHIPGGEALAAKTFCFMARYLLSCIGNFLTDGITESFSSFHESIRTEHTELSSYRKSILQAFRQFKFVFHESSERARQVITFAKTLRKDLEIATQFKLLVPSVELLLKLKETGHIRVVSPQTSSHVMFIPGNLQHCETFIWQLVDMTCGHEVLDAGSDQAIYLIMIQCDKFELHGSYWEGSTIVLEPTAEATITLSHVEVDGLLLVVNHSSQLVAQCKKFQKVMGDTLLVDKQQTSCNHAIAEALGNLKSEALELWEKLAHTVKEVEERLDVTSLQGFDDSDKITLGVRCIEVLHQGYQFGFEYHKAVTRLITGEARTKFNFSLACFARKWMKFVADKCEQGRGLRPRWAKQGLEFLAAIYDQSYVQAMQEEDFIDMKQNLNSCIRHLLGCSEKSPITSHIVRSPKSGGIHSPRTPFSYNFMGHRSQSFSSSRGDVLSPSSIVVGEEWLSQKRVRDESVIFNDEHSSFSMDDGLPLERVRKALDVLEQEQQKKLQKRCVIGHVSEIVMQKTPFHISARRVTFPWQRCFKIGEGRFGKVYTAVNNVTGELIAMKEIRLQPNDHRAIKGAIDEIRTFEGIKHQNLVRYYGVELHREEMLIFMEYCNEGSLESASQLQLPESLIRKYTRQLLEAVNVLHEHGIVHRDIKSANIFLTSDGNLKLGDFGCSIKLKNNTTLPGELCGFVGTPAYMAPEIFTKNIKEGHGRAADIWSLGCVVLEMVTSKRPWYELESSYQIMFAVGMGGIPEVPDILSDEGKDFLSHCLIYNPQERWTACQLLDHPFTKVHEDEYS